MPVHKPSKKKKWRWTLAMSKREYEKLARIVERCYRDGVLTQGERNTLMKVSERIEEIKAKENKLCRKS